MNHFINHASLRDTLSCLRVADRSVILREADRVLAGTWDIFPGITARLEVHPRWNHAVRSHAVWVDHRGSAQILPPWNTEDIKFVWELNRMQFLLPLAQAHILTGDARYKQEAQRLMNHWIDAHKDRRGVNWISGLETAVRVIGWIWAIEMTGSEDYRIIENIRQQCIFIAGHLQKRDCPNNHLIGELAALAITGIVFPEFPEAKRWVRDGLSCLSDQIERQTSADGVDREQAWDYHRFVADFYTLVVLHCKFAGLDVPAVLYRRLEKMYEAMLFAVRPDGWLPGSGDDDNARVVRLCADPGRFALSALSTGAALFRRQDMKYVCKEIHAETLWLMGIDGKRTFEELLTSVPLRSSTSLHESGQIIMRSNWQPDTSYLYFDCGDQGMGEAGHGHADALHFELYAFGAPRIVDAGTYLYNGCPAWRNYFRGTAAHNTLRIDSTDQSTPVQARDPFGWKKKSDARCVAWKPSETEDTAVGCHNGYAGRGITHQRSITFRKPHAWLVVDDIKGAGEHTCEVFLHFPQGTIISKNSESNLTATYADKAQLSIGFGQPEGLTIEIIKGALRPVQGWVSESYGSRVPAPVICARRKTRLPLRFETTITAFEADTQCA